MHNVKLKKKEVVVKVESRSAENTFMIERRPENDRCGTPVSRSRTGVVTVSVWVSVWVSAGEKNNARKRETILLVLPCESGNSPSSTSKGILPASLLMPFLSPRETQRSAIGSTQA